MQAPSMPRIPSSCAGSLDGLRTPPVSGAKWEQLIVDYCRGYWEVQRMRPTESSDPGVVQAVLNSFYGYQGWDQQLLSALIAPLSDRMEWYWWNNAGAGGPVPPFVPGWEDDPWPYTYDEWKGILTETFAPDPFAEEREVERAEREAVAV